MQMLNYWKNKLNDRNATDKEYPKEKTIHKLFEEQVERTPDNIAVVYEGIELTYKELNERANQLANYIREKYVINPDTLIALCLERSEYMLIAILAVLKAGGAYVPLDFSYPDERIKYILEDTGVELVLITKAYEKRISTLSRKKNIANFLVINSLWKQIKKQSLINLTIEVTSANLVYVLYTSGTTGFPKGVMINHISVVNLLFQDGLENKFDSNKQGVLWTNITFDVSVYEIFSVLLNGSTLHVLSSFVREDLFKFLSYVESKEINYAYIPPYFVGEFNKIQNCKLELVLLGVDKIKFSDVSQITSNKSIKILNGYGPTESTVFCSKYIYSKKDAHFGKLPIGFPISNTKCYVLNSNLTSLPVGAIGELYIGGVGLARGYLNRPDLTAEKFIANPFRTKEELDQGRNGRLYKTGDLVRWLPDGNLEYIGRNDFQVKIKGYRIELGEIESVLASYEGIKQSVVLAKEHKNLDTNNKKEVSGRHLDLVGYYVSENRLDEEAILDYLRNKLPEYMVPSILVYLEKFPLTVNGKLDRKALPDPEFVNTESYVAPQNELEKNLCQIWAKVLGLSVDKIGVQDNFFKLGGNSILAIKLIAKINEELNSDIQYLTIFERNTIKKLIEYYYQKSENSVISYEEKWSF